MLTPDQPSRPVANGRVTKSVALPHVCDPGWTWTPFPAGHAFAGSRHGTPPSSWEYPKGTVWRCNCGQHWVSRGATGRPGVVGWRRESLRKRHRRLGLRWWQREYAHRHDEDVQKTAEWEAEK